jgi:signal transduction histidine kinase
MDGLAQDGQMLPQRRTSFAYNENTLTAYFSSLSFRDERRTEFQWMLAGFDSSWQPPRTERHVRYTHLPRGTYTFLVRARNGRTSWSEPAGLTFVIHPPFWGTWWFVGFVVAGIAGSLWLVYRLRVRSLENERLAEQTFSRQLMALQENERKRIAGELHDSLVQTLLVAKNRSLLGLKNTADPERVSRELSEISSAMTDAIDEVREIAHNLRPYQLDRLGLTQALRSLGGTMSESSAVKCSADIENIDGIFSAEESTIVYRIVQESANNILKHSGASDASITVKRVPPGISIIVRDNGGGFRHDPSMPSHTDGFGLTGLAQRVKILGGKLTVDSVVDGGTTISVTIPLRQGHS